MTSSGFKSQPCLSPTGGMKPHLFPLILASLAVVAALAGESGNLWLRYQADAIWSGEIWRLVTAHLAHLGWSHTFMNMAGLALVWWLVGALLRTRDWLLVYFVCSLAISCGLLFRDTQLMWYVGLSGILHGMLAAGAWAAIRRGQHDGLALLLVLVLKLVWEQWQGALPGSAELAGGAVVVNAHLYGAIAGLISGMLLLSLAPVVHSDSLVIIE